jgi:hypothetical protein
MWTGTAPSVYRLATSLMDLGYNPGGAGLPAHVQTDPRFYTLCTGSFPGLMLPGHGVHHPPTFNAEVNEREKLYLYSPSRSACPLLR